ncbi:MAG: nucleotidyltransferase domain-containing protein [Arcobacter sp.]|nr:nucleotidyltransferase domain-containing protein [Arcobacter sp.]
MLNKDSILLQLKELKPEFQKDEVNILGLFGSYARDEENKNSDIDILIETTPLFLEKYRGLKAYAKLEDLKNIIKDTFHKEIDFVAKSELNQHSNTYILNKAIYV